MGSGPSCPIHKMRRPPWMNSSLLQHSQTFGHQIVGVMWWNSLLRHVQFSIKHLKPLNGYLFIYGQIKLYVKVKVQNLGQDAQCSSFGPVTFPGMSRTISDFRTQDSSSTPAGVKSSSRPQHTTSAGHVGLGWGRVSQRCVHSERGPRSRARPVPSEGVWTYWGIA